LSGAFISSSSAGTTLNNALSLVLSRFRRRRVLRGGLVIGGFGTRYLLRLHLQPRPSLPIALCRQLRQIQWRRPVPSAIATTTATNSKITGTPPARRRRGIYAGLPRLLRRHRNRHDRLTVQSCRRSNLGSLRKCPSAVAPACCGDLGVGRRVVAMALVNRPPPLNLAECSTQCNGNDGRGWKCRRNKVPVPKPR